MATTPEFLPGESHRKGAWWATFCEVTELNTTVWLTLLLLLLYLKTTKGVLSLQDVPFPMSMSSKSSLREQSINRRMCIAKVNHAVVKLWHQLSLYYLRKIVCKVEPGELTRKLFRYCLYCCFLFNCWVVSDSLGTLWAVAHQAPLSLVFSRQEYWTGWPFTTPGDLSNPGTESTSPALAGVFFTTKEASLYSWVQIIHKCNSSFEVPEFWDQTDLVMLKWWS